MRRLVFTFIAVITLSAAAFVTKADVLPTDAIPSEIQNVPAFGDPLGPVAEVVVSVPDTSHFFSVFGPEDRDRNDGACAYVTGEDLEADQDLAHYGTCFLNDRGTFKIIELSSYFPASFADSMRSDSFVGVSDVLIE